MGSINKNTSREKQVELTRTRYILYENFDEKSLFAFSFPKSVVVLTHVENPGSM